MDNNVDQGLEGLLGKADIVLISAVGQSFRRGVTSLLSRGLERVLLLESEANISSMLPSTSRRLTDVVSRTVSGILHRGGG